VILLTTVVTTESTNDVTVNCIAEEDPALRLHVCVICIFSARSVADTTAAEIHTWLSLLYERYLLTALFALIFAVMRAQNCARVSVGCPPSRKVIVAVNAFAARFPCITEMFCAATAPISSKHFAMHTLPAAVTFKSALFTDVPGFSAITLIVLPAAVAENPDVP